MVVNTINSKDVHKVEYVNPGEDMSRSSLNQFLPQLNSLGITSETVANTPGGGFKIIMSLCELHPKSFLSNFWGAVNYDTASSISAYAMITL